MVFLDYNLNYETNVFGRSLFRFSDSFPLKNVLVVLNPTAVIAAVWPFLSKIVMEIIDCSGKCVLFSKSIFFSLQFFELFPVKKKKKVCCKGEYVSNLFEVLRCFIHHLI